jgi:hypothetical protein
MLFAAGAMPTEFAAALQYIFVNAFPKITTLTLDLAGGRTRVLPRCQLSSLAFQCWKCPTLLTPAHLCRCLRRYLLLLLRLAPLKQCLISSVGPACSLRLCEFSVSEFLSHSKLKTM